MLPPRPVYRAEGERLTGAEPWFVRPDSRLPDFHSERLQILERAGSGYGGSLKTVISVARIVDA